MNAPHSDRSLPGPPHPDPERLALAALPAEAADPAVASHLLTCGRCRTEVADLRRVVELAREGDALPAPPPQVWREIAAELGLSRDPSAAGERNGQVKGGATLLPPAPPPSAPPQRAAPPDVDDPGEHPGRHRSTVERLPRLRRRLLVPLVAAALGLLAGLGVGHALSPRPGPAPVAGPVARLVPVGNLDPAASGTVAMADAGGERQMVVQVQGVTNIEGGDHLEAWLMDATGTRLVPLGALDGGNGDFHGTFALPEGVPLGVFGRVDISAERWDGNPAHSTLSVLRGDV